MGRQCFDYRAHSIGELCNQGENAFSTHEALDHFGSYITLTAGAVNLKIGKNIVHIAKENSIHI